MFHDTLLGIYNLHIYANACDFRKRTAYAGNGKVHAIKKALGVWALLLSIIIIYLLSQNIQNG